MRMQILKQLTSVWKINMKLFVSTSTLTLQAKLQFLHSQILSAKNYENTELTTVKMFDN